jgi:hypothetical protein
MSTGCKRDWNCFHTQSGDHRAWFLVDFQRPYTVSNIRIYTRIQGDYGKNGKKDARMRMAGVHDLVDARECHYWESYADNRKIPVPQDDYKFWDYECTADPRPTGRYLRFQKDPKPYYGYDEYVHLAFCEVQVWVCKSGFYGDPKGQCKRCQTPCPFFCDNYYGCVNEESWRNGKKGLHNLNMMRPVALGVDNQNAVFPKYPAAFAVDGRILNRDFYKVVSIFMDSRSDFVRVDLGGLHMLLYAVITFALGLEHHVQEIEVRASRVVRGPTASGNGGELENDERCWRENNDGSKSMSHACSSCGASLETVHSCPRGNTWRILYAGTAHGQTCML